MQTQVRHAKKFETDILGSGSCRIPPKTGRHGRQLPALKGQHATWWPECCIQFCKHLPARCDKIPSQVCTPGCLISSFETCRWRHRDQDWRQDDCRNSFHLHTTPSRTRPVQVIAQHTQSPCSSESCIQTVMCITAHVQHIEASAPAFWNAIRGHSFHDSAEQGKLLQGATPKRGSQCCSPSRSRFKSPGRASKWPAGCLTAAGQAPSAAALHSSRSPRHQQETQIEMGGQRQHRRTSIRRYSVLSRCYPC